MQAGACEVLFVCNYMAPLDSRSASPKATVPGGWAIIPMTGDGGQELTPPEQWEQGLQKLGHGVAGTLHWTQP